MKHIHIGILSLFCLVLPLCADTPVDRTIGEIYLPEAPAIEELAYSIRTDLLDAPLNTPPPVSIDTIRERITMVECTELLSDIIYLLHRHELERDPTDFNHYQRFYEQFKDWFLGISWPSQADAGDYTAFIQTALSSGRLLPELGTALITFTTQVTTYGLENGKHHAPPRTVEELSLLIHTDLTAHGTAGPLNLNTIKTRILLVEGLEPLNEGLHVLHAHERDHLLSGTGPSPLIEFYTVFEQWFVNGLWPEQNSLNRYIQSLNDAVTAGTFLQSEADYLITFTQNVKNYHIMWLAASNDGGGLRGGTLAALCVGGMLTLTALAIVSYWWLQKKNVSFPKPNLSTHLPRQRLFQRRSPGGPAPPTALIPPHPLRTPAPSTPPADYTRMAPASQLSSPVTPPAASPAVPAPPPPTPVSPPAPTSPVTPASAPRLGRAAHRTSSHRRALSLPPDLNGGTKPNRSACRIPLPPSPVFDLTLPARVTAALVAHSPPAATASQQQK